MIRLTLQDDVGAEVVLEDESPDATQEKIPLTLRQIYCIVHSCNTEEFQDHLFWRTLYPHALPFALCLELVNPTFFRFERELIDALGSSSTKQQLDRELLHFNNRRMLRWLRGRAQIRISTQRLARIASAYLDLAPSNDQIHPLVA